MPVYRLIEEGLVPGKNFIQVALRGSYPDAAAFEWMRAVGTISYGVTFGWSF